MEFLEVGQIVNVHGLRGEVKINPWADDASVFETLPTLYDRKRGRSFTVEGVRYHKGCAIVKLKGTDDRTAAESLRGTVLSANRADMPPLPEGVHYIVDLIGMQVRTKDSVLGVLKDVLSTGSNDVYVVAREGKRDLLLPVIDEVVRETDMDRRTILVELLEGLVDDEAL